MIISKKQIQSAIAILVTVGFVGGGSVMLNKDVKQEDINERLVTLIKKSHEGKLTYNEYLNLIELYNFEIKKAKEKGGKFELKNINKDNDVIQRLNDKILE